MAARLAPVKVDESTHQLILFGANLLHMQQKELLAAAVREYLDARRDMLNAGMRDAMKMLDDTRGSRVAALAGVSKERLAELGGVRE